MAQCSCQKTDSFLRNAMEQISNRAIYEVPPTSIQGLKLLLLFLFEVFFCAYLEEDKSILRNGSRIIIIVSKGGNMRMASDENYGHV